MVIFSPSDADLYSLSNAKLSLLLKEKGLKSTGSKDALVNRLIEYRTNPRLVHSREIASR